MLKTIHNHLLARPISAILRTTQTENEKTLKLMYIIDCCLQRWQLYPDILKYPKLLEQLLRFKSYENFQFYEYKMKKKPFGQLLLGCQCCEFVAPYIITLEHMVVNHGRHRSAEECQWCCSSTIHQHIASNTLERCYSEYINKHQINVDPSVCQLIEMVFKHLRVLAEDLGVLTVHHCNYRARNSIGTEIIVLDDTDKDDISSEVFVSKPFVRNKTMNIDQLNKIFQKALQYFDEDMIQLGKRKPNHMSDQSVPKMPRLQQTQKPPQHTPFRQQEQPHAQRSPPLGPMPPISSSSHTNIISPEINHLANLMVLSLQTLHNDTIRAKALFNIKKTILQHSAEDLQWQLENRNKK